MIERLQAKRNEEGFTLIELLIVIIVLGILAAIVVFAVGSTRKDSVASSCKTNYKSLELSMEAVNTKMGSYPASVETSNFPAAATAAPLLSSNTLGPNSTTNGAILKAWPTSSDYAFRYDGAGSIQVYRHGAVFAAADGSVTSGTLATNQGSSAACDDPAL